MRRQLHQGFTIIEVLIALAVIVVLIILVLPVYLSARGRAVDADCLSNIHQANLALSLYVSDYDGHYPTAVSAIFERGQASSDKTWRDLIVPYLKLPRFPQCPLAMPSANIIAEARQIDICGYAYNQRLSLVSRAQTSNEYFGRNEVSVIYPSTTVALCDTRPGILVIKQPDTTGQGKKIPGIWRADLTEDILNLAPGAFRHHGGANYSMVDGHTKWFLSDQFNLQSTNDGVRPGFGL